MALMTRIHEQDEDRGDRIADLMNRGGWGNKALADEIGCERTAPWRWKKGLPIEARFVGPLAAALGTTRGWIVSGPAAGRGVGPEALDRAAAGLGESEPPEEKGDATGTEGAGG